MGKTVAITGINSYFAQTVIPKLVADDTVDRIIGIDVTPQRKAYPKLEHVQEDIRSPRLGELFKGVHTVYHMAFIVAELRDKKKAWDININGSKNVFEACVKNGVKKVVYTSSATAYGAHSDNCLSITEDKPLRGNKDSYYSFGKVQVENFVTEYFQKHSEVKLVVLRVALGVGPNINNMFSDFWSRKIYGFMLGRHPHLQLIHEQDLGEALYLAFKKNLQGTYNVAASDGIPARWAFKQAGVRLVDLPTPIMKVLANVAFNLHLEKVSQGWVSLSEYSIHMNTDKFRKATGWEPKFSSEAAFMDYLSHRTSPGKTGRAS
ncbi:MAG: NAD-dependent epimerase/dehydratase family protein [Desulfatibacillum sp.]|nr:NAD-dependent epimerase/dehydratase family protein [Desulfatibacillum sp.]